MAEGGTVVFGEEEGKKKRSDVSNVLPPLGILDRSTTTEPRPPGLLHQSSIKILLVVVEGSDSECSLL